MTFLLSDRARNAKLTNYCKLLKVNQAAERAVSSSGMTGTCPPLPGLEPTTAGLDGRGSNHLAMGQKITPLLYYSF